MCSQDHFVLLSTTQVQVESSTTTQSSLVYCYFRNVSGNAGGIFSIEPSLGVVSLTRPLMESEPSEYLLLVRAMDHASQARAASVPVRVMVTSSPDAPPSWQGEDTPRVVEVGEWMATGSAVARLTASSPSSLHYTLTGGNDEGVFMVSPASGVVSLATPLDYETTAWYNLTITATNLVRYTSHNYP